MNNRVALNADTINDLYINQHKTIKELSNILSCSPGTIFNFMRSNNIKTRKKSEVFTFKGKKHSAKVCSIISATHKGKVVSEETRIKISKAKSINTQGHKKIRKDGYIAVYYPSHPYSEKSGYIMEHHLVVEKAISRYLLPDEIVHHKNFKKDDNRIENLQIMTRSEHMRLHNHIKKMKGIEICH